MNHRQIPAWLWALGASVIAHAAFVASLVAIPTGKQIAIDAPASIEFSAGQPIRVRFTPQAESSGTEPISGTVVSAVSQSSGAGVSPVIDPSASTKGGADRWTSLATSITTTAQRVWDKLQSNAAALASAMRQARSADPSPAASPPPPPSHPTESAISPSSLSSVSSPPTAPGIDREPGVLAMPHPEYPSASARRGEQGTAIVEIDVRADGSPATVRLLRSSGFRLLDNAAIDAARRARYRPATRRGGAIDSTLIVPFEFTLER